MHLGLRDNWLRSEAGQSLRASRWGRNGRCPVKNGVGFRAGINGCLHYFATEKKKCWKWKLCFFLSTLDKREGMIGADSLWLFLLLGYKVEKFFPLEGTFALHQEEIVIYIWSIFARPWWFPEQHTGVLLRENGGKSWLIFFATPFLDGLNRSSFKKCFYSLLPLKLETNFSSIS